MIQLTDLFFCLLQRHHWADTRRDIKSTHWFSVGNSSKRFVYISIMQFISDLSSRVQALKGNYLASKKLK